MKKIILGAALLIAGMCFGTASTVNAQQKTQTVTVAKKSAKAAAVKTAKVVKADAKECAKAAKCAKKADCPNKDKCTKNAKSTCCKKNK